MITAKLKPD